MSPSARLLVPDGGPRADGVACAVGAAFLAAIPTLVDGGAHVVAVHRYCPADEDGPASATVLVHWGADDELPEWGTHIMSWEADLGRHLLWQAAYFDDLGTAWADLRSRMPAWPAVPHEAMRRSSGRVPCRARPVWRVG